MEDKEMYLHLCRECERARVMMEEAEQIIIAAQQKCEEMYLEAEEEN
ncbi:MAG: hypothetical protein KBS74_07985 [Clostridiales bacterium]|nr:hypothetical protein [Candidatus Cacconaster stercorequi]